MGLRDVPKEHLLFLVQKLSQVEEPVREALMKKAASRSPEDRAEVVAALEKEFPGTEKRLSEVWSPDEGRAFFMWDLLDLGEMDGAEEVSAAVLRAVRRPSGSASRADLHGAEGITLPRGGHRKQPGFARVASARMADQVLHLRVLIDKAISYLYEDDPKSDVRSRAVDVVLDMRSQSPALKAFATRSDALKAVIASIEWLKGRPIGTSRPEQDQVIRARTFTEQRIKSLKRSMKLDVFDLTGVGADGKTLKSIRALAQGAIPGALDERGADYTELDAKELRKRGLQFRFTHTDGYIEIASARFYFDKRQSHISFATHSSNPAMESVIATVYGP